MCAAIVQPHLTYSIYYLVLRVSYDLCAVYLYYFDAFTQIFCALVAPTKLVQTPLPTACRPSRANSGAPVLVPDNIFTSILPLYHQSLIQSTRTTQPVAKQPAHKNQFLLANPREQISIQSIRYYSNVPADTTQSIQSIQNLL